MTAGPSLSSLSMTVGAGAAFLPPPATSPLLAGWPGRRRLSAAQASRPPPSIPSPSPSRVVAVTTPRVHGRRRAPTRRAAGTAGGSSSSNAVGGSSSSGGSGGGGGSGAMAATSRPLLGSSRRGSRRPRRVTRDSPAKANTETEATGGLERAMGAGVKRGGSPRAAPAAAASQPRRELDPGRKCSAAGAPTGVAAAVAYRRGRLNAVRAAALEALGFPWSSPPPGWGRQIAELTAFKAAHGHLRIPHHTKLGIWLTIQRSAARHGRLGAPRLAALNQVDANWAGKTEAWGARAARWEAYVALTGDVEVRQAGRKAAIGAAAKEEKHAADAVGTTLGNQQWQQRNSGVAVNGAAAARVRAKARADAAAAAAGLPKATPLPFSVSGNPDPEAFDLPRLYNWVVSQRLLRRSGRLRAERVARLDASGFVWDVHETAWRCNLLRYIATRDAALRLRASMTPSAPPASALPPPPVPSIAGLELLTPSLLGVVKTDALQVALAQLSPAEWQELFRPVSLPPVPVAPLPSTSEPRLPTPLRVSPLSAEAEACLLPPALPEPLASVPLWVTTQRRRLATGTLPRARLVTLLDVGFPFRALDVLWEAHTDALAAMVGPPREGEHHRVRVARASAACVNDARLFFWVRCQRAAAAAGVLPAGRAARLRELGALSTCGMSNYT
ncbi:hypothetical protein MMPV_001573 [Pyropia vietnamensis]